MSKLTDIPQTPVAPVLAPKVKYDLLVACYPFKCGICGRGVSRGTFFVTIDDADVCVSCGLPAQRLVPLKK